MSDFLTHKHPPTANIVRSAQFPVELRHFPEESFHRRLSAARTRPAHELYRFWLPSANSFIDWGLVHRALNCRENIYQQKKTPSLRKVSLHTLLDALITDRLTTLRYGSAGVSLRRLTSSPEQILAQRLSTRQA